MKFFEILFDEGDWISYGNIYTNIVKPLPTSGTHEFFSINPISAIKDYSGKSDSGRRADINVTKFRNFLFEFDNISLEDQLKVINSVDIPFTSVVYSGSKSYHCIISLEKPLDAEVHTKAGVNEYKRTWERLAARIDLDARKILNYDLDHVVDPSCKNPSRFSRFPGNIRDTGKEQKLIKLEKRLKQDKFKQILSNCPEVFKSDIQKIQAPEFEIMSKEAFWACCSEGLYNKIKFCSRWVSDTNMYPEIYRLTLWAIDETNVEKSVWCDIMEEYVLPELASVGYDLDKCSLGIDHAYSFKGAESE